MSYVFFILKNKDINFIFLFFLFYYLFINTGIHGDDYIQIYNFRNSNILDFFNINPNSKGILIFNLFNYFFFWWVYLINDLNNFYLIDTLKFIINFISFFLYIIFY